MPDWVQIGNEITRGTQWPVAQLKVPGSTEYNPPERDIWNADGSPGPAVFTLDNLTALTARPASHAPPAVNP
jgi:hypothetical protein